jgi:hypothetical protein
MVRMKLGHLYSLSLSSLPIISCPKLPLWFWLGSAFLALITQMLAAPFTRLSARFIAPCLPKLHSQHLSNSPTTHRF